MFKGLINFSLVDNLGCNILIKLREFSILSNTLVEI